MCLFFKDKLILIEFCIMCSAGYMWNGRGGGRRPKASTWVSKLFVPLALDHSPLLPPASILQCPRALSPSLRACRGCYWLVLRCYQTRDNDERVLWERTFPTLCSCWYVGESVRATSQDMTESLWGYRYSSWTMCDSDAKDTAHVIQIILVIFIYVCMLSCSVLSNSLWPWGL